MSAKSRAHFWETLHKRGFYTYEQYLQSTHWQRLRSEFYNSRYFKGRCQCCGVKDVRFELHHKTYRRITHERLSDLTALCPTCHEITHSTLKNDPSVNVWTATKKVRNTLRRGLGKTFSKHRVVHRFRSRHIQSERFREGNFIVTEGRLIYNPI